MNKNDPFTAQVLSLSQARAA